MATEIICPGCKKYIGLQLGFGPKISHTVKEVEVLVRDKGDKVWVPKKGYICYGIKTG